MFASILAVVIFLFMFIMIIMDKIERHYVTLGCGAATCILVFGLGLKSFSAFWETLNVAQIGTLDFWYAAGEAAESTSGINWATILFLAGMMIMVEGMAHAGFFRWLCMTIAKAVNYRVIPIFLSFMAMSFVLAMFIDSITVILFLAAVTIELARMIEFNPIPMILSEIFCANLGGSATMCGDPPNIIIGTALGYSFVDFLTNTGVIAVISLVVVMVYFYAVCKKDLVPLGDMDEEELAIANPAAAIKSKKEFAISCLIFAIAVVLLVTHAMTGLTVAFIGVLVAILTILASIMHLKEVMKGVDYKTLLFFVGLFLVIGGLEQTGILEIIANFIGEISGGNMYVMIAIIIWVSAIASALVDNIPFSATMIPIITSLSATTGANLSVLAWTLAMGTDIGGSATPIGASANVVGTSIAAREGYPISWGRYLIKSVPATIMVVAISMVAIYLRYL